MAGRRRGGPGGERGARPGATYAIVGRSPAIHALIGQIERVGPTAATVLILGERGTGKELLARAIASASGWRGGRPFVAINCAALPTELLAAELFGHERGEFTGAVERRPGLLAAVHGGTVFLDEIGDLSPAGQAMLLRFVQEGEVRPVGASAAQRVDVRVIAATNRALTGVTREGPTGDGFRADLHDRLSEVVIQVPPLRERAEDIPLLAAHFLAVHAARHRRPRPRLSAPALTALARHAWPGNVRELEQALSRAVIFCEGGTIRASDLALDGLRPLTSDARADGLARSARARDILRWAGERGTIRRGDVMARGGVSGECARRALVALARHCLLRREGQGRGSRYLCGVTPDEHEGGAHARNETG
jgi:two-component system response regulator HydG